MQADQSGAPAFEPGTIEGLRVLVVDDSATNRQLMCAMLESWGCLTQQVDSGRSALAALRKSVGREPAGLVLLDMQMPDLDGEQTAHQIQSDPELAGVPIVMLSSLGDRANTERLRSLGIAASLNKPVRELALYNAIASALGVATALADHGESRDLSPQPGLRAGLRVLLAEDNPVNQKVALRMLEKWGIRADAVSTGREAVRMLEHVPYDVVLMDVQMPDMDGFEATTEIRLREATTGHHTPIIALTAHAMQGDRRRCLVVGMDDYISKPVDADHLRAALARWAGAAPVGAVLEPPAELAELVAEAAAPAAGAELPANVIPIESARTARRAVPAPVNAAVQPELTREVISMPESRHPHDDAANMPGDDSTPRAAGGPAVDFERFAEISFDDAAFERELISEFSASTAAQIADLRAAVRDGNPSGVQRAGHALKGSCLTLGAMGMGDIAERLERLGGEGRLDGVAELISVMNEEFSKVQALFEQFLERRAA